MAAAGAARRAVGEVVVQPAGRARAGIRDALGGEAGPAQIAREGAREVDMPPVRGDVRAIAVHEPGAHLGARLEAFRVDVRTQVGVERCGRRGRRYAQLGGVARGQEPHGLPGDAGYRPAPAGVDDGEAPRGRGEHHRHAVGEAQQRRDPGNGGDKSVGARERRFARGIERLDLLIITHFDKDHVGGADKVLESVSVAQVVMPQYAKESKQYTQFRDALSQSPQTRVEILSAGSEWSADFGKTHLRVTAAEQTDYGADEENDFSLATYVTYGETKFLFPGDAEDARQTELLRAGDIACDVLKVPYHGRIVDASTAFLTACSPKIAFIPDSDDDPADPLVMQILQELGTDVHSGRDGDLTVVSDGKDVFVEK